MVILHAFSGHVPKPGGMCVFFSTLRLQRIIASLVHFYVTRVCVFQALRTSVVWSFSVMQCYNLAKANGYKYFGLQFYGECWASNDSSRFRRYGQVTSCYHGLGGKWTNYVYMIR